MVLEDGREAELWVGFTPPLHHNQVSQVVDEVTVMRFLFLNALHNAVLCNIIMCLSERTIV